MKCWEQRGCNGDMYVDCPHNTIDLCPRGCMYTICDKPQHELASGMEIFSAYDVDFSAARKENCHSCKFFLAHAPRINQSA